MSNKLPVLVCILAGLMTGCEDHRLSDPQNVQVSVLASGLVGPIGLEVGSHGRVWVAEAGSGQNDGRVSMITPDGRVHPVITGFDSQIILGGELDGINHILFADGVLYILGSHSRLYKADVDAFEPGHPPMQAKDLPFEDVHQFVLNHNFAEDTGESHLYNMTMGPEGALYFTDAGANAILRRASNGVWTVLTALPGFPNPTPVGPPVIESVPTGITFDGTNFFISTLTGFPFPEGAASVYRMDRNGNVSLHQPGFTTLVDVNASTSPGLLTVQFGRFGPQGFMPNTGQVRRVTHTGSSQAIGGLNMPTDLVQGDAHTYYVSSLGDGTVLKVMHLW